MNEKVTRVFNGWLALSDSERAELQKAIGEYLENDNLGKRILVEKVEALVTKMQTGPLGGSCPCCGR